MSDSFFKIRRVSGHTGNFIPSGRQLPRTPPLADVRRHLDFCDEEIQPSVQARNKDENNQEVMLGSNSFPTKTEPEDPQSMLRGMKGYQLTQTDLEFIEKMKEEKLVKKLQTDLEEIQKLLKTEVMEFELVCAAREKAQAELQKLPSREDLIQWMKVVLETMPLSSDLTDLDALTLLATLTKDDVQRAVDKKRSELARMEKMVADKKKREVQERGQLEKRIAGEQMKIQSLISQLAILKCELSQQEEAYKALSMQISTQEAKKAKVEAEDVKPSEEPQTAKAKSQGKERKKAAEKLQNTTKPTRSKVPEAKTDKLSRKQAAAEQVEHPGLRRSKRIASRR
ncbi:uncharacterized protein LOC109990197 [Xyrichtys novacula]|uniref:Uncharacterized protein LOC109990197 n=1 Tax=Xyrichtys novacula TaxID=13765 RepID=A0AAV1HPG2_XYRNO|nr:uncharacterized protein LOC109990197 [Xyrichtys novacula]